MPEPEKTLEQIQLEQIESLKTQMSAMVDPEEYKKLKSQYETLLNDYVNKRTPPKIEPPKVRPTKEVAAELSKIKSGDVANRDYIAKALEYRTAFLREYGKDPFSDNGQPNPETEEVVTKLQVLLDQYQNASDFRHHLNELLQDDPQTLAKLRKKRAS